ncbi:hypothetical protein SLEP1_g6713 [Rubroshorea leprosula]|uniref:Uncharacterized protein n=1 Tax=Rubroshorea leprosula TaxID=152421 RepID=A0AAV5HW38_9ROSI|nr:hypothetical protein SLEP1_g6713 [Rubroshorea leprosula]
MFCVRNPVCVSCDLPKLCPPCAAREIGEILVALSYVLSVV